jgi:hypothetical protein
MRETVSTVEGGAWIGVDPGARWTGIAARSYTDDVLGHAVVDRLAVDPDSKTVTPAYLEAIVEAIGVVTHDAGIDTHMAIEDIVGPVGYEFIRPSDLIGLGIVLGYLMRAYPEACLVRPAKHGTRPLHTYPLELSTPGERAYATRANTWGRAAPKSNAIRHARSAWDVAGAGPSNHARIQS